MHDVSINDRVSFGLEPDGEVAVAAARATKKLDQNFSPLCKISDVAMYAYHVSQHKCIPLPRLQDSLERCHRDFLGRCFASLQDSCGSDVSFFLCEKPRACSIRRIRKEDVRCKPNGNSHALLFRSAVVPSIHNALMTYATYDV